jgi:hypothetical protein
LIISFTIKQLMFYCKNALVLIKNTNFLIVLLTGNLPWNILAGHVQLDVQSYDLLLHEQQVCSRILTNLKTFYLGTPKKP